MGCPWASSETIRAAAWLITALARLRALPTAEVSGGCFCCRFDDLLAATGALAAAAPQMILAEPVGSCTDLAATVLRPLAALHAARYALAPLSVVVDAPRLLRLIRGAPDEQADDLSYLFTKQLEEADLLLLNKQDLLSSEQLELVGRWLATTYPGRPVLPLCAARGEGVAAWLERVMAPGQAVAARPLDLDYARYAHAEARMGWLNASGTLPGERAGSARDWAASFLGLLAARLDAAALPVAHVKLQVAPVGGPAPAALKASLVGPPPSQVVWDLSDAPGPAAGARWLLNARVDAAHDGGRAIVETALRETAGPTAAPDPASLESFQPAAPQPTHRLVLA